ncbi:hypothetical protein [Paenibacillus harenae]|uniref:hypothetical protein n=1 Tax=Paenibacillus harenae TaxID=306543 RepID=UPI00040B2266|nr:hypothetical protein [Paenibacillus harenae]
MVHQFVIAPLTYNVFEDEAAQIAKCKEWGLLSEKASKTKNFYYKGNGLNVSCSIIGYVDDMAAVIQFDNSRLHCIHPSYLKEMQASSYGAKQSAAADRSAGQEIVEEPAAEEMTAADVSTEAAKPAEAATEVTASEETAIGESAAEEAVTAEPPKGKAKKEKTQKLQLPEEKVKMTAVVKEFTTVPNNFSDTEDEVIIYEAAAILEPALEVGPVWSSHSSTLKKLELEVGDTLAFECKIVAKKLTKHPVPYKINNPSKLQKNPG